MAPASPIQNYAVNLALAAGLSVFGVLALVHAWRGTYQPPAIEISPKTIVSTAQGLLRRRVEIAFAEVRGLALESVDGTARLTIYGPKAEIIVTQKASEDRTDFDMICDLLRQSFPDLAETVPDVMTWDFNG